MNRSLRNIGILLWALLWSAPVLASGPYSTAYGESRFEFGYEAGAYGIYPPGTSRARRENDAVFAEKKARRTYLAIRQKVKALVEQGPANGVSVIDYVATLPVLELDPRRRKGFEAASEGPWPRNIRMDELGEFSITLTVNGPLRPKAIYWLKDSLMAVVKSVVSPIEDSSPVKAEIEVLPYAHAIVETQGYVLCAQSHFRVDKENGPRFTEQLKQYLGLVQKDLEEKRTEAGVSLLPVAKVISPWKKSIELQKPIFWRCEVELEPTPEPLRMEPEDLHQTTYWTDTLAVTMVTSVIHNKLDTAWPDYSSFRNLCSEALARFVPESSERVAAQSTSVSTKKADVPSDNTKKSNPVLPVAIIGLLFLAAVLVWQIIGRGRNDS